MMQYFLNDTNNEIKLVTSHRQVIDGEGNLLPDVYSTMPLFDTDTIIEGYN